MTYTSNKERFELYNEVYDSIAVNKVFSCYLAASRPTLGHNRGESLTHQMLITAILHTRPERHKEVRNEGCKEGSNNASIYRIHSCYMQNQPHIQYF